MNWKRVLIGKWSWWRPIQSITAIYLLLLVFVVSSADSLIFQPPETPYSTSWEHFTTIEDTQGTRIAAYYRPAAEAMPTILWSHGNAENLATVKHAMDGLHELGYGVLAYDYPGYGESLAPSQASTSPSEQGCYRAIEASYQFLTKAKNIPAKKILLAGQSVGSGPTCWLAAKEPHAGVLLISPFLSAFRTVTRIALFPFDRFPNLHHIKKINTPLLIVHGENDRVIPFSDGKSLYNLSASSEKTFLPIPTAGHNDIFIKGAIPIFEAINHLTDSFKKE